MGCELLGAIYSDEDFERKNKAIRENFEDEFVKKKYKNYISEVHGIRGNIYFKNLNIYKKNQLLGKRRGVTLLFTSSVGGEGVSSIISSYATIAAAEGLKTLVISTKGDFGF